MSYLSFLNLIFFIIIIRLFILKYSFGGWPFGLDNCYMFCPTTAAILQFSVIFLICSFYCPSTILACPLVRINSVACFPCRITRNLLHFAVCPSVSPVLVTRMEAIDNNTINIRIIHVQVPHEMSKKSSKTSD